MQIQEIYELIERFDGSGLNRLKLELGETKLVLEKGLTPAAVMTGSLPAAAPSAAFGTPEKEKEEIVEEIRAPFVGTFYRAPSPEEKPFVVPGQAVKKGDVVGIIEAMKMMNEIVAAKDGVVDKLLAEDGSLVGYNQVLMTLK